MATFLNEQGLSTLVTQIKAEDTKILNKLGTVPAGKTAQGEIEALEGLVGSTSVSSQIDAKLTAAGVSSTERVGTRLAAAEEKLTTIQGDASTAGSINKALADAKSYTDTKDTAMDARVDKLEATHAKVGGTGADKDNFQTVAQEVATGIANLRDGADAAFDTLKEIANWINDSDANKTGYNAVKHIGDLETAVNTINGTGAGSIFKAVSDETTRVNNILGTKFSSTATVTASMNAAEGEIDDLQGLLGLSKLASTGANSSTFVSRIAANESAISTLNASNATPGSVAKRIKDAVDALDATVGSTTVADGKNVAVQVAEIAGKLTGVTVTQKDIASAAALTKLTTLMGATELATGGTDVVTRIGALESKTGTGDTATQITNAINALNATVGSTTVATGKHVAVQAVEAKGVLTGVTVTESDIASAALLGTTNDAKTATTAFGYIAKEADDRATAITNAVNALDATVRSSNMNASDAITSGNVAVKVVEAAGKLSSVSVVTNDIASAALLGTATDASTANTAFGKIAKEVADRGAAITTAIQALNATVRGNMSDADAVTAANKVGVKVVEENGKLTDVIVVTNDIASASALSTLTGRVDAITAIADATITALF